MSGPSLRAVLESPDRVFRTETWDPRNLITSGYYARLAGKPLVVPHGPDGYRAISEGDPPSSGFKLRPGESAVVSTIECFSVALDITVSISQRFGWAAKGLLMLHGGTAHPGYGLKRQPPDGAWVPEDDVRLYFVVANVGPEDLFLEPGDKIAYLQFFTVEPDFEQDPVPSKGYEFLRDRLYGKAEDAGGLSFFRTIKELETEVARLGTAQTGAARAAEELATKQRDALRGEWDTYQAKLSGEIDTLRSKVEGAETTADRATNASNYVVVFGVFLVAAAIFGVVLESLAGALEQVNSEKLDWRDITVLVVAGVYVLAAIGGVAVVAKSIWRGVG